MSSSSEPVWNSVTYQVNVPLWLITGLATAFVVARLVSRGPLSNPVAYGWDDAVLAVSMVTCLIGAAVLSAAVTAGTEVSLENMPGTLPKAFVLDIAANTIYIISIPLPKIAVAIFLIRIFVPSQLTRVILVGGCILVLLLAVAEFVMNWLQCNPAATQWNPWKYPDGHCWKGSVTGDAAFFLGALSAFQDFALATYPLTQLKKLQLSTARKAILSLLMGMGFAAGAFAILKTYELHHIKGNPANPAGLYNISLYTGLWSAVENDVVIIAACIPSVVPALKWIRVRSMGGWSSISAISLLPAKARSRSKWSEGSASQHSASVEHQQSVGAEEEDYAITKTVVLLQTVDPPHQTV